jgi:hypothetical protein
LLIKTVLYWVSASVSWRDLPEQFEPRNMVALRFRRWTPTCGKVVSDRADAQLCSGNLAVQVQAASVQDPVGAAPVLAQAKALQVLWTDARYQGPLVVTAATALGKRTL